MISGRVVRWRWSAKRKSRRFSPGLPASKMLWVTMRTSPIVAPGGTTMGAGSAGGLAGGLSGKVILPGKSAESLLVKMIGGQIDGKRMPMTGDPLSNEQIGLIRRWIDDGASWPVARALYEGPSGYSDLAAGKKLYALPDAHRMNFACVEVADKAPQSKGCPLSRPTNLRRKRAFGARRGRVFAKIGIRRNTAIEMKTRFNLRTLVILTAVVPPMLWGIFLFFKIPGTLYWTGIFLVAFLICFPACAFRLYLATRMK